MNRSTVLYFAITNMIIAMLSGWVALQYTYVDAAGQLFSIPVSTELPTELSMPDIDSLFFWGLLGFLFGVWSWFIFNRLLRGLFERFGSPQNVPDQAIFHTNALHFRKAVFTAAFIWLMIGLAVVFIFSIPQGFTLYKSWLIIIGYFFTGGLSSLIAHLLLMRIGRLVGF